MARVLVVDDDPVAREVVQDTLTEAGHEVLLAEEGAQMMKLLLAEEVDVVLLDVKLPGFTGDRLATILRKSLEPPLPAVILFSSLEKEELRRMARQQNVAGFLKKGCPRETLVRAVEAAARDRGTGIAGLETRI